MDQVDGPNVPVADLDILLCRTCKKRYRGSQADTCRCCGKTIKLDLGRHVANYHLVSWCTQWKGSPQDCVEHLRQAQAMPSTVKAANLGKWFPPWTVSRESWREVLKPNISGISMDIILFSERGASLVHHYHVFGGGSAHISLRGSYMTKLRAFTVKAEAAGRWAHHGESARPAAVRPVSVYPRDIHQRDSDFDLPRRKSRQAVSPRKPDMILCCIHRAAVCLPPNIV